MIFLCNAPSRRARTPVGGKISARAWAFRPRLRATSANRHARRASGPASSMTARKSMKSRLGGVQRTLLRVNRTYFRSQPSAQTHRSANRARAPSPADRHRTLRPTARTVRAAFGCHATLRSSRLFASVFRFQHAQRPDAAGLFVSRSGRARCAVAGRFEERQRSNWKKSITLCRANGTSASRCNATRNVSGRAWRRRLPSRTRR